MKHTVPGTLALAVVVATLVMAPAAFSQEAFCPNVRIPFDFHIGNRVFPAGTYAIRSLDHGQIVQVSGSKGHEILSLTMPVPSRSSDSLSRFVFNRYGSAYFLAQVHWAGSSNGRGLHRSRLEQEIARNFSVERIVATAR